MAKEVVVTGFNVLSAGQGKIEADEYNRDLALVDTGAHEINRAQKILLASFLRTLSSAGIAPEAVANERASFFMGNSYGIEGFKTDFFRVYQSSDPSLTSPSLFPFTTANALSAWLAIQTGICGPNTTFVSGCNASSQALLAAYDAILAGECDIAFCAGISLLYDDLKEEFVASGFKQEVVAFVVLEEEGKARAMGRKILGKIADFRFERLSKERLEQLKSGSKETGRREAASVNPGITFLGNNLGDHFFGYGADAEGNVFDAAGVLSVIYAANGTGKLVACSSVDNSGSVVNFSFARI
jgi:3-oxoacyl-(acyl-carrier-protein) synthase